MRVLAISGSLRRDSHNTRLLAGAAELLPQGAQLVLWDEMREIPPFDEDAERPAPASVQRLREAVLAADAVLIATPEYNASVPGQLKNALDWLSRPFESNPLRGKRAAVIGASTGLFGAVWAQAEVRKILGIMGAVVDDRELPVGSAADRIDAHGRLRDIALGEALAEMLADLVPDVAEVALAA